MEMTPRRIEIIKIVDASIALKNDNWSEKKHPDRAIASLLCAAFTATCYEAPTEEWIGFWCSLFPEYADNFRKTAATFYEDDQKIAEEPDMPRRELHEMKTKLKDFVARRA